MSRGNPIFQSWGFRYLWLETELGSSARTASIQRLYCLFSLWGSLLLLAYLDPWNTVSSTVCGALRIYSGPALPGIPASIPIAASDTEYHLAGSRVYSQSCFGTCPHYRGQSSKPHGL